MCIELRNTSIFNFNELTSNLFPVLVLESNQEVHDMNKIIACECDKGTKVGISQIDLKHVLKDNRWQSFNVKLEDYSGHVLVCQYDSKSNIHVLDVFLECRQSGALGMFGYRIPSSWCEKSQMVTFAICNFSASFQTLAPI